MFQYMITNLLDNYRSSLPAGKATRLITHKRCAITAEKDSMSEAKRTLYLGAIVSNICQSNSHANAVIRFTGWMCRVIIHVTMQVQSAKDLRQPTLINTFGQVRAPVRSFQTAIKEESNAKHFLTLWMTYYYINIHHCKNRKSHSIVVGSDLNARCPYIQSDQPTLAADSWVSTLGYLYRIKCKHASVLPNLRLQSSGMWSHFDL